MQHQGLSSVGSTEFASVVDVILMRNNWKLRNFSCFLLYLNVVLPSQWCSIVTNSIGADLVVGHSLSQPEVVKSIRFGFESKKGTTYCNVFAIGLTLRRFIRFKCSLAIDSGSM